MLYYPVVELVPLTSLTHFTSLHFTSLQSVEEKRKGERKKERVPVFFPPACEKLGKGEKEGRRRMGGNGTSRTGGVD